MAALGFAFDANAVAPAAPYEPLPTGEYPAIIIDSSMEPTKSGTGQFLKLTFQVIDGPQKDRTFYDRLNLVNTNQTAVDIAQRTLSAICHAVDVLQVQDSSQLHHRPLLARLILKPGDAQYGPSNEVKGYKPFSALAQAPAAAPAAQAPFAPSAPPHAAPPQAPAGTAPWMAGKAA